MQELKSAVASEAKVAAVKAILDSIVEAVAAAGKLGAPAGHLYAALMAYGFDIHQFESIMNVLVRAGKLERRGDLYFVI